MKKATSKTPRAVNVEELRASLMKKDVFILGMKCQDPPPGMTTTTETERQFAPPLIQSLIQT